LPFGTDYESYGPELFLFGTPKNLVVNTLEIFLQTKVIAWNYSKADGPFKDGDTLCEDNTNSVFTRAIP
jgi:hypothetical protein